MVRAIDEWPCAVVYDRRAMSLAVLRRYDYQRPFCFRRWAFDQAMALQGYKCCWFICPAFLQRGRSHAANACLDGSLPSWTIRFFKVSYWRRESVALPLVRLHFILHSILNDESAHSDGWRPHLPAPRGGEVHILMDGGPGGGEVRPPFRMECKMKSPPPANPLPPLFFFCCLLLL